MSAVPAGGASSSSTIAAYRAWLTETLVIAAALSTCALRRTPFQIAAFDYLASLAGAAGAAVDGAVAGAVS